LNGLNMQLAYGATRLASDPGAIEANQRVLRVWDEIRQDLWSHLQIEDGLVSWGEAHHAIPGPLLDTLKNERQEMRNLIATLRELSSGADREQTAGARTVFAKTLLALARTLDMSRAMMVESCPRYFARCSQIAFPLSRGGRDNPRGPISFRLL
jgi:hypothetical protein